MITDIEDYFRLGCGRCARFATADCSVRLWSEGVNVLRGLCRGAGLDEAVKWGHPCYVHAGRNIAIIGAFRDDFRLSFFDAALLDDPGGVLQRQGPNTPQPDAIRFRAADEVAAQRGAILALLAQGMAHAAAGRRPPKADAAADLPPVLVAALDADPELAEAFHRLTPGRQRSHALHVSQARAEATQVARIAALRGRILSGKGANER